jgi:hypothetical protein
MLTPAPLARSAELAKELAFAYQVPAVLLAEVVAAEDRRLRDEAWAAQEAAREARVADAMAAAEAAGTEYVPTEEDEYVEPEAPPAPLDPANISGCIAAALSREKRPDGAVIVMPEQPTVFATKEQLLEAVVLALGYAPPPPPEPPPDPKAKKGAEGDKKAEEDEEIKAVDVENLKGQAGIPDFWSRSIKNNQMIFELVKEKDEPILKFIKHVESERVEAEEGKPDSRKHLIVKFYFNKNEYFTEEVLSVKVVYRPDSDDEVERIVGTPISWADETKDPTKKKIKKK